MEFTQELQKIEKLFQNRLTDTGKKPSEKIQRIYALVVNTIVNIRVAHLECEQVNFPLSHEEIQQIIKETQEQVLVGGGALSEEQIPDYELPPQDVDVFVQTEQIDDTNHTKWMMKEESIFEELLERELRKKGTFTTNCVKEEVPGYHTFLKIKNIFTGFFDDVPDTRVEIILSEEISIGYDMTFRECYYAGGNVITTEKALEDIQNKRIVFSNVDSELSSYLRAQAFSERYGFEIDPVSEEWVLKSLIYDLEQAASFHKKSWTEELEERLEKVKKYKNTNSENLLLQKLNKITCDRTEQAELRKIKSMFQGETAKAFRKLVEYTRATQQGEFQKIYTVPVKPLLPTFATLVEGEEKTKISDQKALTILASFQKLEKEQKIKQAFNQGSAASDFYDKINGVYCEWRKKEGIRSYWDLSGYDDPSVNLTYGYQEYVKLKMDNALRKGRWTGKIFALEETYDYYGKEADIAANLFAEEMHMRPDWNEYLYRPADSRKNRCLRFDYAYDNNSKFDKSFGYIQSKEDLVISGHTFGYLANQRRSHLLEQLNRAILTLPRRSEWEFEHELGQLNEFQNKNIELVPFSREIEHETLKKIKKHVETRKKENEILQNDMQNTFDNENYLDELPF